MRVDARLLVLFSIGLSGNLKGFLPVSECKNQAFGQNLKISSKRDDLARPATQQKIKSIRDYYVEENIKKGSYYTRSDVSTSQASLFHQKFFEDFIRGSFNQQQFADVLENESWPMCHVLELLVELNVNPVDTNGVLRLLSNKVTMCRSMKASVVNKVLSTMIPAVKSHFKDYKKKDRAINAMRKNIQRMILDRLTDDIQSFEEDPIEFADDLSGRIAMLVKSGDTPEFMNNAGEEIHKEKLRAVIAKLTTGMLSATSWSQDDLTKSIDQFIEMGSNIIAMTNKRIVNDLDEFDSLLWSLTTSMIKFIKQPQAATPEFLEQLKKKITNNQIPFLIFEEPCQNVASKKDLLLATIDDAQKKRPADFQTASSKKEIAVATVSVEPAKADSALDELSIELEALLSITDDVAP